MPIKNIPGSDWRYLLICYDADGNERADDPDGRLSQKARDVAGDSSAPITDVIIMSHGWLGDVPAAQRQYDAWTGVAAGCADDIARLRTVRPGFKPLIIGLHWPSQPWGDEAIAAGAQSFGIGAGSGTAVDFYASVLGDSPEVRGLLDRVLTTASTTQIEPAALPPDMVSDYRALEQAAGLRGDGAKAAPGLDRPSFDPEGTFQAAKTQEGPVPAFGGGFGLSNLLAPLRMLTFWKMKNRARLFGERGAHELASALQTATAGRDVRFHAMGHSFGCIVVSAMIAGPGGDGTPRPFDSATLVQGAVSLWAYCADIPDSTDPGYFNSLIARKRVRGPIVTTQSTFDSAVGKAYPLGAGLAGQVAFGGPGGVPSLPKYGGIGTFGIQGPGVAIQNLDMGARDHAYAFAAATVHNLQADTYIKGHSDIAKPEVAHAMWSAIASA